MITKRDRTIGVGVRPRPNEHQLSLRKALRTLPPVRILAVPFAAAGSTIPAHADH
jgi:hypothetical protein